VAGVALGDDLLRSLSEAATARGSRRDVGVALPDFVVSAAAQARNKIRAAALLDRPPPHANVANRKAPNHRSVSCREEQA